jgi:hypothetical protein
MPENAHYLLLLSLGMHEDYIGVPAPADIERLAGALRNDLYIDSGLGFKHWQDTVISFAAAWPLAARAQHPDRMRRVGVLSSDCWEDSVEHH